MLHDEEQIRMAREDIREALALRLQQNREEIEAHLDQLTQPIREKLTQQRSASFWGWLRHHLI